MRKFLKIKTFFQKICKKFQPLTTGTKKFPAAAADREKKLKFSSRRRRSPKSFLTAADEGRKKLKIFSRRRRERRQLTPLFIDSNEDELTG
jgi:hypothetical protein